MILRLMQKHGHQPIVLLGGGTTLIGDPSGKDSTRKILNKIKLKKTLKVLKKFLIKFLTHRIKNSTHIYR